MQSLLTQITDYLVAQSWQIAILAAVIAAASLLLKNRSAHLRYLLWLVVVFKCLVPPMLSIPVPVLPPRQQAGAAPMTVAEMPLMVFEAVDGSSAESALVPSVLAAVPREPTISERLSRITVREWLAFGWITGVVCFLLFALQKARRTSRRFRRRRRPLSAELEADINSLFAGLGIRTTPKIWLIDGIGQPFVWGLPRGNIYLPANFARVKNAEHRRSLLMHELNHILRLDAAVNILQIIAQGIFWFHPLVWWTNRKLRQEREKCCDEMSIARLGASPKDYSNAIVNVLSAERALSRPLPSLAVASPVRNIEDRIKAIMNPGRKFYKRPGIMTVILVLLLAVLAVPTTFALTPRRVGTDATAQPSSGETDRKVQILYDCKILKLPADLEIIENGREEKDVKGTFVRLGHEYADRLESLSQESKDVKTLTAPKLITLEGEEATAAKGHNIAYTTGYEPSTDVNDEPRAIVKTVFCGIELKVSGKVVGSSNVRTQIHLCVRQLGEDFETQVDDEGREIQIPAVEATECTTVVAAPADKPIIIGGLKSDNDTELVLIMTPHIVSAEGSTDDDRVTFTDLAAEYAALNDLQRALEYKQKVLEAGGAKPTYGIGISIANTAGSIRVVDLLPETPAYNSGLARGDVIEAVDGFSTKDMSVGEVVRKIVGPKGTEVTLTVRHADADSTEDITLTREKALSFVPSEYDRRVAAYESGKSSPQYRDILIQEGRPPVRVLYEVLKLRHVDPQEVVKRLTRLLKDRTMGTNSQISRNVQFEALPGTDQLVVFGNESDIEALKQLVTELDIARSTELKSEAASDSVVTIFKLKYTDCEELAKTLSMLFEAEKKERDGTLPTTDLVSGQLTIIPDSRSNHLIVQGTKADVKIIKALLPWIDVSDNTMPEFVKTQIDKLLAPIFRHVRRLFSTYKEKDWATMQARLERLMKEGAENIDRIAEAVSTYTTDKQEEQILHRIIGDFGVLCNGLYDALQDRDTRTIELVLQDFDLLLQDYDQLREYRKLALVAKGPTTRAQRASRSPKKIASTLPDGTAGYALEFDGRDDFVMIPPSKSLDIHGSLTVSVWVKQGGGAHGVIVWRGDGGVARDPYALELTQDKMMFRMDIGDGRQRARRFAFSKDPVDDQWHFWSAVRDKEAHKMYLYKDGSLEGTADIDGEFEYDTSQMWNMFGAVTLYRHSSEHFEGAIDEVRIWNIARSQQEIRRDMNRSLTGTEPGLVGYWKFDDDERDIIKNSTPYLSNGVPGELLWNGE